MTASFAMKETFDKIQAKLESAERKTQLKFGQNKREINEFKTEETEAIQEENEEEEFKRPVSGRTSKSVKGGKQSTGARSTRRPIENDEDDDKEVVMRARRSTRTPSNA